jgi:two-component system, sensor histidine kinase LadS
VIDAVSRTRLRRQALARGLGLLCAVLSLSLVPGPAAQAAADLVLDATRSSYGIAGHLDYLVDADDTMRIEDVRVAPFSPVLETPATFGFARGTHWFHLGLRNDSHPRGEWLLAIAYALLDHAELYTVHADGRVDRFVSGDRVPFASRAVRHRHITFPLAVAAGERVDLYLRVRTASSVQVPLEIVETNAFLARAPAEHLGLGLYYGIMLGLLCYNLILFLSVRDRTFLYYVLYVATFALGQLCLNGLAFEHFWPTHPAWANLAVLLSIGASLICMLLFTRSFLDLPRHFPAADRVAVTVIAALALTLAAVPVLGYRATILVETALVFVIAMLIATSAIVVYRRGFTPARNFIIAWSVLLVGVVAYASVSFGLLPKVFLTEYGIQLGSAGEMILLSFALAYRINTLREENQRILTEAREQLETRVAARTHELDSAMHQLRQANNALRDFSLRDGLTAVHNRRYFDAALPEAWERARREQRPVALLMVDIDHFKQINDRHGHLLGDDCLRVVAQTLVAQLARRDAHIVRYGGEEFVVILSGTNVATPMLTARSSRATCSAPATARSTRRSAAGATASSRTPSSKPAPDRRGG